MLHKGENRINNVGLVQSKHHHHYLIEM